MRPIKLECLLLASFLKAILIFVIKANRSSHRSEDTSDFQSSDYTEEYSTRKNTLAYSVTTKKAL